MKKRVLIVAGEASGDHHAAALIKATLKLDPEIHFFGMGGDKMREAGADIIIDIQDMGVVGAIELLSHFRPLYRAWASLSDILWQNSPDLVVLLDYPGFNLRLAKVAKKAGIKVLYYISPQVWAWKRQRVHLIRECVDKMLVIFPFEEALYREAGVPVEFVGHPLVGKVKADKDPQTMRAQLNLDANQRVIALLPGSRRGEIKRLLPVMLQAASALHIAYPDTAFLLPLASSLSPQDIAPYLMATTLNVHVVEHDFYNAVSLSTAAIVTSGTATLETALLNVPMVIVYRASWLTYHMAKHVVKIPHIGLCNIVAGKSIVKELIQDDVSVPNLTREISRILTDTNYRTTMIEAMQQIKEKLGMPGGSEKAAHALSALL